MIYVILPVHNRAALTARFIGDLVLQTHRDFKLVLVDDGCTDGTVEVVRQAIPAHQLEVLHGSGQLWWAGALQMAYEHLAKHSLTHDDAVLIVNDDVRLQPDFLAQGLAVLQTHPQACIQALSVDPATGQVDRGAVAETRRRLAFRAASANEKPNCLCTRGLLMRGPTFANSGGFRPRWLPHYLSDYEFTIRLARSGVPMVVEPSFSLNANHGTTGERAFDGAGLRAYLRHSLSNRAMYNPKHWSAMAVMVCPPWLAPLIVARIWLGFFGDGLRVAMRRPTLAR